MNYKHTQVGTLMVVVLFFVIIEFVVLLQFTDTNEWIFWVMGGVILLIASFTTLTVEVGGGFLTVRFGYGIFTKKIPLHEITQVKVVRHSWYHGWGIRYTGKLWIYNVSGFNLVEVQLQNGKTYAIGTNEPRKLEAVLKGYIQQA